jgi:hypothetical protein
LLRLSVSLLSGIPLSDGVAIGRFFSEPIGRTRKFGETGGIPFFGDFFRALILIRLGIGLLIAALITISWNYYSKSQCQYSNNFNKHLNDGNAINQIL